MFFYDQSKEIVLNSENIENLVVQPTVHEWTIFAVMTSGRYMEIGSFENRDFAKVIQTILAERINSTENNMLEIERLLGAKSHEDIAFYRFMEK